MKAKHRHELHTNLLADRFGRLLQSMRGGARSNTSLLVWTFIILAIATYALWQYSASAGQSDRSEQWMALGDAVRDSAQGEGALIALANSSTGTIPDRSARFEVARKEQQVGNENLYGRGDPTKREAAAKSLIDARKLYQQLSRECIDSPLLAQEALFGAATTEESLVGVPDPDQPEKTCGELEQAIEYYQKLVNDFPDSTLAKAATARLEDIQRNRQKVEKFYAEINHLSGPKDKPKAKDNAAKK